MMQILLQQETTGSNSTYCKKDLRGASLKNIEGEISLLSSTPNLSATRSAGSIAPSLVRVPKAVCRASSLGANLCSCASLLLPNRRRLIDR